MRRLLLATGAGVIGLALGCGFAIGVFAVAGRFAGSLFAIVAMLLGFPSIGFALAFQLAWAHLEPRQANPLA